MEKDEHKHKRFLEQQLEWCKKQDRILVGFEMKLYKMKKVAEYAFNHELTSLQTDQLNGQLKELESDVHFLEKKLHSVVH
ncbi:hypothetical protein ABFY59_22300 [Priestia aryabhattai]|uniref:hypothetical protein n=1 Tax=Priestia aryabhattai TaxID=412384 RepID=UPI003D2791BF